MRYLIIFIVLLCCFIIYQFIAKRFSIVDNPNNRSSHSYQAIRGGGVVFPVAALLWFLFFGYNYVLGITALIFISVISFLDDLYGMSRMIRVIVQLISVILLFIQFSLFEFHWVIWTTALIVMIGWINAFNFMDGINGMTPFYSLVSLGTFFMLSTGVYFVPADFMIVISMSILIFSWFNVRKRARAFAGDVGSISMAFILGGIMLYLIIKTGRPEYIMFFAVYAADSIFTIIHRLIRRENIFKAHRSHLYQYLSNELDIPHVTVSIIYSSLQFIINVFTIWAIGRGIMNMGTFFLITIIISIIYLSVRFRVLKIADRRIQAHKNRD